jgi:hypothetical protein
MWLSLRASTSHTFIYVYIKALTSRIHCSEAALLFAEDTTFMFLSRKCRYHLLTEQDGFLVPQVHHFYIDCTIMGQGWNLEELLPAFFLASKIRFLPRL